MARRTKNTETAQQTETDTMTDVQFQDETMTDTNGIRADEAEVAHNTTDPAEGQENHDEAEGTEAESATRTPREPAHTFNQGDVAMIVRGKYRQEKMTIIKFSEAKKTYAGELESGEIVVVNATNLKPPADSTISQRALAEKLNIISQNPEMVDLVTRLAVMLDDIAPEFSVKLAEVRNA